MKKRRKKEERIAVHRYILVVAVLMPNSVNSDLNEYNKCKMGMYDGINNTAR